MVPSAAPGGSCEARVRAVERVIVNGKEELLFSGFTASAVCETPLPPPVEETSKDLQPEPDKEEEGSRDDQQRSLRERLREPKCVSALFMIVLVGIGILLAVIMAQFIS